MEDIELAVWKETRRREINKVINTLAENADPKKLPILKKAITVNNSLVELFWELMIYREKCGLKPIAHPHG